MHKKMIKKESSLKKKIQKNKFLLIVLTLFLIVFSTKLFFSLNQEHFSDDKTYLELRYIENIQENKIIKTDDLTYNGRNIPFVPIINYFIAVFSFFINTEFLLKFIQALVSSSFMIIVYLLATVITKNQKIALVSSIFSSTIPYVIKNMFNTYSSTNLAIFFIFYLLYLFIKIKENKKYINVYISLLFFTSLISPLVLVFSIGLIIYYLITSVHDIKILPYEKELILFSFITTLLVEFFLFKDFLLLHGVKILWQNIPEIIMPSLYPSFSLTYTAYLLGLSTLVIATKAIYQKITDKKDTSFFLILCFTITTLILTWLKLLKFQIGVSLIALILPIYTIYFFQDLNRFIKETKFYKKINFIFLFFILIFTITNLLPTIQIIKSTDSIVQEEDIESFNWIKKNVDDNSTILADFEYSNLINYFTRKKTLTNTQFLGIKKINELFDDIQTIKTSKIKTKVIGLTSKYNINYIILNKKQNTNLFNRNLFEDDCFVNSFENSQVKILRVKCQLE